MFGTRVRIISGLLTGVAVMSLMACGGDKAATPTATATAQPTATHTAQPTATPEAVAGLAPEFCSALVMLDAARSPGGEESEAAYIAAIKDYADAIEGPLATMQANAPRTLDRSLQTISDIVVKLHDGDIEAYENPESSIAIEDMEEAAREGCGWQTVSVTATDYEFTLDKYTVPAGPVSFQLTNNGQEPHVFLLLRKPSNDTRPASDIVGEFLEKVSSGDPDQFAEVASEDVPGGGPFAIPGASGTHVLNLAPADYIYWCPIPQGEAGDGPPHFMLGMVGQITVS